MDTLTDILIATLDLYLDAALWLMVGIIAAGLIHALLPKGLLAKKLGGRGAGPIVKAALIGAPLPLCSCGVLPAAVGLRRDGASKGATVSFLIATPETGPDSVAVSYALLGPFMAIIRPIAAIVSAIVSGLLTSAVLKGEDHTPKPKIARPCCAAKSSDSDLPLPTRVWGGLSYGFTAILDDIAVWLVVGLALSGVMIVLIPPDALGAYGTGLSGIVMMLVIGIPIYVCATASTPIAVGLLSVGVSPGAVLVFLLAGPATNLATLGVVGKELGSRALVGYLLGLALSAVLAGLATDALLIALDINISGQMQATGEALPKWLERAAGLILAPFLVLSLGKEAKKLVWR